MSIFTPDTLVDGEYAVAAELNAMFTAIASILNGGIVNENVNASAAITPSKIAGGAPVKVATTIAGLGTPFDGMTGLLRLGSTPYNFVPLVYDGTLGKWVSDEVWAFEHSAGYPFTSFYFENGTTSYVETTCFQFIKHWKQKYDAGLRLQVAYAGTLFTSSGGTEARMGVNLSDFDDGDSSFASLATGYDASNTTSALPLHKARTDWAEPAVAPTQTHGRVAVAIASQTGSVTASAARLALGTRFVNA